MSEHEEASQEFMSQQSGDSHGLLTSEMLAKMTSSKSAEIKMSSSSHSHSHQSSKTVISSSGSAHELKNWGESLEGDRDQTSFDPSACTGLADQTFDLEFLNKTSEWKNEQKGGVSQTSSNGAQAQKTEQKESKLPKDFTPAKLEDILAKSLTSSSVSGASSFTESYESSKKTAESNQSFGESYTNTSSSHDGQSDMGHQTFVKNQDYDDADERAEVEDKTLMDFFQLSRKTDDQKLMSEVLGESKMVHDAEEHHEISAAAELLKKEAEKAQTKDSERSETYYDVMINSPPKIDVFQDSSYDPSTGVKSTTKQVTSQQQGQSEDASKQWRQATEERLDTKDSPNTKEMTTSAKKESEISEKKETEGGGYSSFSFQSEHSMRSESKSTTKSSNGGQEQQESTTDRFLKDAEQKLEQLKAQQAKKMATVLQMKDGKQKERSPKIDVKLATATSSAQEQTGSEEASEQSKSGGQESPGIIASMTSALSSYVSSVFSSSTRSSTTKTETRSTAEHEN